MVFPLDRHEHAAGAVFRGIVDEVAEHLVEVLPFDPDLRLVVAGNVDGHALVEPVDCALHPFEALPHDCARMRRCAAPDGAGTREMVVDLAAHHRRLADHRLVEVGRIGGGGVGDHGERSLQRMREIAGVAPRLLGLGFAMGEKLVDLFSQRADLGREVLADTGLLARADRSDIAPHPPQRPQTVESLQRGETKQPRAERGEAPDQRLAQPVDLLVHRFA